MKIDSVLQFATYFLIGCLFCLFVEFCVRPKYDTDYEHKILSHNGYNYCPYCGENLYDSENIVTIESGEVKNE